MRQPHHSVDPKLPVSILRNCPEPYEATTIRLGYLIRLETGNSICPVNYLRRTRLRAKALGLEHDARPLRRTRESRSAEFAAFLVNSARGCHNCSFCLVVLLVIDRLQIGDRLGRSKLCVGLCPQRVPQPA